MGYRLPQGWGRGCHWADILGGRGGLGQRWGGVRSGKKPLAFFGATC